MSRLNRECEYPERYEMLTRETEFDLEERRRQRRADLFATSAGISFGVIAVAVLALLISVFA